MLFESLLKIFFRCAQSYSLQFPVVIGKEGTDGCRQCQLLEERPVMMAPAETDRMWKGAHKLLNDSGA